MVRKVSNRPLSSPPVILICASNHKELCDAAFVRSGRMSTELHFGIPDAEGRKSILLAQLRRFQTSFCETVINDIVEETEGRTGADITKLVRDAISISSVQMKEPALSMINSEEALSPEMMELMVTTPTVTDDHLQEALALLTEIPIPRVKRRFSSANAQREYARSCRKNR